MPGSIRRIALRTAALLAVVAAAPAHAGGAGPCGDTACPDHVLCYKVKAPKAPDGAPPFPRFTPRQTSLADRLGGPATFDVKKPLVLCNPANKNGEDPSAPASDRHLEGYQAKRAKGQAKFTRKGSLFEARNQLHPNGLMLKVTGEERVLVATAKVVGTGGTTAAPPSVADFKCYKVAVAKAKRGQPPFPSFVPKLGVSLVDQFATARLYDLTKPTRACHPVLDGTPPQDDAPAHLVCYQAKLAKSPKQEKVPKQQVSTNNAFGPEVLETGAPQELCVPTAVTPSATDLVIALDPVVVQARMVHENFPALIRPAIETYNPEVSTLIAQGPAALTAILPRFAGTATILDDMPLVLLAYALERIGDPRAVPVLLAWLQANLFSELIWAPDFVTHAIKVLTGQAGLNTVTFTYSIGEMLDTLAQANGPATLSAAATTAGTVAASPTLARSAGTPRAAAVTAEVCPKQLIVTGINAEGQEEDFAIGYKVAARDIDDMIAAEQNDAQRFKLQTIKTDWRSVDEQHYGTGDYVPVGPGADVSLKSNCSGKVIEKIFNKISQLNGYSLRLGEGGSDATKLRELALKFGGEVPIGQIDETTVISHDRSSGDSAHVEVPVAVNGNQVTVISKDNYGLERSHVVLKNGDVRAEFEPAIRAYDKRPWYNPFTTITPRFYRIDPSRIVRLRLDSTACPCRPGAAGQIPVAITQPTQSTTDKRTIVVSGTVGDASVTDGILKVNKAPQPIGVSSGAFFTTAVLQAGDNAVNVTVDSPTGERGCAERTIKSTAPEATISVTLTWNRDQTDLDLYVTQPDMETAWYSDKTTSIGGELDTDNTEGRGPETYFLSSQQGDDVLPGPYAVRVHYYNDELDGDDTPTRVVTWRAEVILNEGTPAASRTIYEGSLATANSGNDNPGSNGSDWATVTTVTIPAAN